MGRTHEDNAFEPIRFTVLHHIVDGQNYDGIGGVSQRGSFGSLMDDAPAKNKAIDSYGSKRKVSGLPIIHARVMMKLGVKW